MGIEEACRGDIGTVGYWMMRTMEMEDELLGEDGAPDYGCELVLLSARIYKGWRGACLTIQMPA